MSVPSGSRRASLRKVVGNAVSILSSDVFNRAATFVIYALVARYLGAFEFGQMSLALSLFYTLQVLAVAGLKTLVIREVAKDRTNTDRYLMNGSLIVVIAFMCDVTLLLLLVRVLGYADDTALIIMLLAVGGLPYALSTICEAVFQAWERMNFIAYANISVNLIKVTLAFLLLSQECELYHIVILILVSHFAVLFVEWSLVLYHITRPCFKIDFAFALAMVRKTIIFLGIDAIIAVNASLQTILLSRLMSETEVGLFSAAGQVVVPVTLIFQSIVISLFPTMCRRFEPSFQGLRRISAYLIEFLLIIAMPMVIGLFFYADSVLLFLYGEEDFLQAVPILRVIIWLIIFKALTTALGQVLLAGLREKITLRIVAINLSVNLVLGLILISQLGLIGAALTVLLTEIVNFFQHYVPVTGLLSKINLVRLAWKPVFASLCMAVYLALDSSWGFLPQVVTGGLVYLMSLLALTLWFSGGPHQLVAQYRRLWSE